MSTDLILFAGNSDGIAACFPQAPAGRPWDEIVSSGWDDLVGRFDLVVTVDGAPAGLVSQGSRLNVAVCCTTWRALAGLVADRLAYTAVFAPSALEVLDHQRRNRETLVVRRDAARDSLLTPDLIATEVGGKGVSADLKHLFVGARIAYDLTANQPLDFGHIL